MKHDTFKIYDRLKTEMKRKKITQKEICSYIGVSQSFFSKQLNGYNSSTQCKAYISLEQAITIQEKFFPELSVNELFTTKEYTLRSESKKVKNE